MIKCPVTTILACATQVLNTSSQQHPNAISKQYTNFKTQLIEDFL